MDIEYIFPLPQRKPPSDIGNKAESLNSLLLDGFPVPATWVCSQKAFQEYKQRGAGVINLLRSEIEGCLDLKRPYAVRSSASLEDGSESSYAGQFKTILDVCGVDQILDAIAAVWQSAADPGIQSYQALHPDQSQDLAMSVLIQEMVEPQVSGVAFSINPITGMNEVIIEAVPGSGEALVQDGVTPWRWVRKWDSWVERPDEADVDQDLIDQVSHLTERIASSREQPVDLEWVYDGNTIYLVQVREVTALDIPLYSNHISREVFPGLIKPLIWSVNVPLVNGAWIRLLTELIGTNEIQPEDLARSFFNRAYFNMGAIGDIMELMGFPRETLELLMGLELEGAQKPSFNPGPKTFALLPRMIGFVLGKFGFGRQVENHSRSAWERYRRVRDLDLSSWSSLKILEHIDSHFQQIQETAYYNIVTPLLMQLFNLLFDRSLKKLGIDPRSVRFDVDERDYHPFDPTDSLKKLSILYKALPEHDRADLEKGGYQALLTLKNGKDLRHGLEAFLDRFGHLSDSGNDFSRVPWRENPNLVLTILTQQFERDRGEEGSHFSDLDLSRIQRWRLTPSYRRALRFQSLREQIGTAYTLGYGLFRPAFLELGERLANQGILHERQDVMYLEWDEIRQAVLDPLSARGYQDLVEERKKELQESENIQPPTTIYGENPVIPAPESTHLLTGTPTSRGLYTGPAAIVHGLEDMHLVEAGDVLVVPYSDVSWTPLFGKAGAVVAEAGGILSHSSIIARELGIPAVVAVPGATRIPPGTTLSVDGNNGQVILRDESVQFGDQS